MIISDTPYYFESDLHKYRVVRKHFALRRYEKHLAPLYYQPDRLRDICKKHRIDILFDAIDTALSIRRSNYFVAFLETLGEKRTLGGWEIYKKIHTLEDAKRMAILVDIMRSRRKI